MIALRQHYNFNMMPDAAPFLAAIRAAPDDDAPRLIYADWLDEHGQPERAEFIRVQCELARRESPELRKREYELLARHHDVFAGPLTAPGLLFRFSRGFPVAFGHTGLFVATQDRASADRFSHYLRFFPNGILHVMSTTLTPKEVRRWHQEACKLALKANYILEPFTTPAVLRASEKLRRGSLPECLIDFSGTLEAGSINLTQFEPETGLRTERHYTHTHVRRFNSFRES